MVSRGQFETTEKVGTRRDGSRPLCSGIYLPEKGGVRIEDTFIMEENGPHLLFTFTKELLELD